MNNNKLDEKVIEVGGKDVILSRLQRHILYSVDEGKAISARYTQEEVDNAWSSLVSLGYLASDSAGRALTWDGVLLVNACRLQSQAPSQSTKAVRATPCKICGQPTEDVIRGSLGNSYAVCHECGVRMKAYKICEVIGHDNMELERFPYPGQQRVSPGILVMERCTRCEKCTPRLDSIYD